MSKHICITTFVRHDYERVYYGFDEKLFISLSPPLMPLRLLRFDGCKTGDEVHLMLPFGQKWVSVIVEDKITDDEIFFVDEGIRLPFVLKKWRHRHRIIKNGTGSKIIDDILFEGSSPFIEKMIYPMLKMAFAYRGSVYRRYFGEGK